MLPGMSLYRLEDAPEVVAPTLIVAFDGWVDAGQASTTAAARLVEGAELVATFDADGLFDLRAPRPTLEILDGKPASLTWPELTVRRAHGGDGRDVLVLAGPEPDYRWRELADRRRRSRCSISPSRGPASRLSATTPRCPTTWPARIPPRPSSCSAPSGVTSGRGRG